MPKRWFLLSSVFIISICGLVYELLAGTLSSYLLGDSVTVFSLVIGFFLGAMGLGSYISRFLTKRLIDYFIQIQILLGLFGGISATVLFMTFTYAEYYTPVLAMFVIIIGTFVGFEIPLLIRILKNEQTLSVAVSSVLGLDYLGAVVGSVLFPLVLAPYMGIVRTSLFFGMMNVAVAMLVILSFKSLIRGTRGLLASSITVFIILGSLFLFSNKMTSVFEDQLYDDTIVYAKTTPYQRIVLTRWRNDVRLYINGALQFSSLDEYRYHESLVHPVMSLAKLPRNILVIGGGDGLALKEVLKYESVENVDLVDIDREITNLFATQKLLTNLNERSLINHKVKIHNMDAMKFLEQTESIYDVVIMDLPDPNTTSIGKLYSKSFFTLAFKHISENGSLVTQATSPYYSRESFWCIVSTIEQTKTYSKKSLFVKPYHVNVPSFGEWGFVLAGINTFNIDAISINVKVKYLTREIVRSLFIFPKDSGRINVQVNELNNQYLVSCYNKNWKSWNY